MGGKQSKNDKNIEKKDDQTLKRESTIKQKTNTTNYVTYFDQERQTVGREQGHRKDTAGEERVCSRSRAGLSESQRRFPSGLGQAQRNTSDVLQRQGDCSHRLKHSFGMTNDRYNTADCSIPSVKNNVSNTFGMDSIGDVKKRTVSEGSECSQNAYSILKSNEVSKESGMTEYTVAKTLVAVKSVFMTDETFEDPSNKSGKVEDVSFKNDHAKTSTLPSSSLTLRDDNQITRLGKNSENNIVRPPKRVTNSTGIENLQNKTVKGHSTDNFEKCQLENVIMKPARPVRQFVHSTSRPNTKETKLCNQTNEESIKADKPFHIRSKSIIVDELDQRYVGTVFRDRGPNDDVTRISSTSENQCSVRTRDLKSMVPSYEISHMKCEDPHYNKLSPMSKINNSFREEHMATTCMSASCKGKCTGAISKKTPKRMLLKHTNSFDDNEEQPSLLTNQTVRMNLDDPIKREILAFDHSLGLLNAKHEVHQKTVNTTQNTNASLNLQITFDQTMLESNAGKQFPKVASFEQENENRNGFTSLELDISSDNDETDKEPIQEDVIDYENKYIRQSRKRSTGTVLYKGIETGIHGIKTTKLLKLNEAEKEAKEGNFDKKAKNISSKQQGNNERKPQVMKIKIIRLPNGMDIQSLLQQRLGHALMFTILEVVDKRSLEVYIEFPSTNASKHAKRILHRSNNKSIIKLWCSPDKRTLNLHDQMANILSAFTTRVTGHAEELIRDHEVLANEMHVKFNKLGGKKNRFQSMEEYSREKKEKDALSSKIQEMESQMTEFKSFLSSVECRLVEMKEASYEENDLLQLENAFEIECTRFKTKLPIFARRTDVVGTIVENQTSVILGETGSGKSTQLTQYLHQTRLFTSGFIVCTQPRKVAAISLANRVAEEMRTTVGTLVGYQVGMQSKKSKDTKILYVTDHILLNECLKDPDLSSFSCIIIDEAHERSIFTDLLLGMIKKALPRRPDLRVVVTSATIDPDIFVRYFVDCPVLAVSGRTFPVDIVWSDEDAFDDYETEALNKAIEVHKTETAGDILVFLTSPLEVEKCCKKLKEKMHSRKDFICLPLHGKLQANEQQRVFEPTPVGRRKIIFATNSAETSITVPGIKYVVDTGRVKELQFDHKKNISALVVTMVTKSSANQRSGRAGRTSPGKCFRLFSDREYDDMRACSVPEILRVNLGQALLKLMELGVEPVNFDYVEPPPKEQMTKAIETLISIGAVRVGKITDLGLWIAKLPFDPIYGAFIHEGLQNNVGIEALVLTACCCSGGSLFYRAGSKSDKEESDKMRILFAHPGGDVMTMLNSYREWHDIPDHSKGRWCSQKYVNGKVIKATRDTVIEALSVLKKEMKIQLKFEFQNPKEVDTLLHKMLFKAFRHNICHYLGHERAGYHVIKKIQNVCLFPSSSLPALGLKPDWIVIEQVLKLESNAYGVNATPVEGEWIEEGLRDGWLNPFGKERAEGEKVLQIAFYGTGENAFNDFVGPRFSTLKSTESELQTRFGDVIVIIDADRKTGEIRLFSTSLMVQVLVPYTDRIIHKIKLKYKKEKSEQYLSSMKQGTRVVIGAGGVITDVLMPDEYKTVNIVCNPSLTSKYTETEIVKRFSRFGTIEHVEKNRYTLNKRNWGRVTYATVQGAERAVENSIHLEITALPTGNKRLQNERRFRAKIEWCRRTSKGIGFVEFGKSSDIIRILLKKTRLMIGGQYAKIARSRKGGNQIFVSNLHPMVNEEVLRHSFEQEFGLNGENFRPIIIRQKVQTSETDIETLQRRINVQISPFVKEGKHDLYIKKPRDTDFSFIGFLTFSRIDEGQAATRHLQTFRLNDQSIIVTVNYQATMMVSNNIFEKCKNYILQKISKHNDRTRGIEIKHRVQRNGNCLIDINCESVETLQNMRQKIEKVIRGRRLTRADFQNINEFFKRSGKYELKQIMSQTDTLIIDDNRILEIAIYGETRNQEAAFQILQDHLFQLTQASLTCLALRGRDKPYGVIKELFVLYGMDFSKLKNEIRGLRSFDLNLRNHNLEIKGSKDAVSKAVAKITEVVDHLRDVQNHSSDEDENRQCAVCMTEVEETDIYRLEVCGHSFCKSTCIIPQLELAITECKLPLACCKEDCNELWSMKDVTRLCMLSGNPMIDLVQKAVISFISKESDRYKYCLTPDCPSIYRATKVQETFFCCECEVKICTACHQQSHDGVSCYRIKALRNLKKESSGIELWLMKDRKNRKQCPKCGMVIEKIGGCNHMECPKCHRHICWICLEHFGSSGDCYRHLGHSHGGYGGDYGYLV